MEFIIVAPVLLGLGLGTVQAGLVYHGNTILNYATFEAARTGAVSNAKLDSMKSELGTRLAPLLGGDGSSTRAFATMGLSKANAEISDALSLTYIDVLNPTREAFEHFKVRSREANIDVIPNSHLRHQISAVDSNSGVSLQDANLLKIRVTYGFDLAVPGMSKIIGPVMALLDPGHSHYYAAGKIPLTSVATVRMQSEVHGDSLRSANAPPSSERFDTPEDLATEETQANLVDDPVDLDEDNLTGGNGGNPNGECSPSSISPIDLSLPTTPADICAVGIEYPEANSSPIEPGAGGIC